MSKINQQEIADRLSISRSTVSRCFTNHPAINPETRSRVFQLASEMGYVHMEPRSPARKQVQRSPVVGVLICTEPAEYLREGRRFESPAQKLMVGVSEFALLEGIQLDLQYLDPGSPSLADLAFQKLARRRMKQWSGVILIYPVPDSVVNDLLLRFPVVSLVEHSGPVDLNCVDVDHYKGISSAVERLTAAGHRRIGFLTLPHEIEAGWSLRRYSAFVEKLARLGMPVDQRDLVNIPPNVMNDISRTFDHVAERIRGGTTAWVCAADYIGYELVEALQERGISVPQLASVTGFDGLNKPKDLPQLSTAIIPYREIGLIGGKRLTDLLGKRFASVQHILVEPGFRDGETVGPPGDAAWNLSA